MTKNFHNEATVEQQEEKIKSHRAEHPNHLKNEVQPKAHEKWKNLQSWIPTAVRYLADAQSAKPVTQTYPAFKREKH